MRKLLSLMALFVISLLAVSMVNALEDANLRFRQVEVNGVEVEDGDVLAVVEGQVLKIEALLYSEAGAADVELDAKISGYEYSDYESLSAATHLFDIVAGTTEPAETLSIRLPRNLEKDEYVLRLRALDRNGAEIESNIHLYIKPARHGMDIADISFSPGNTVKAGRSLLATVLLQNFGDKEEKDVKVTIAIPELGVSATEFVDVVEDENHNVDYEDVPEMFLPIPAMAAEGDYEVRVSVRYDDLVETVVKTATVHVLADERYQQQETLVLAVGPELQVVAAGSTATYAVALTNAGFTSKAYMVQAVTGDWATAKVSESLVVLEPGKNKVVYVDVTPSASAAAGEHAVSVAISSGNNVLETVSLRANVVPAPQQSNGVSLRNGLEIALVVLVVLLVIIGLIIGFSRLRKDEEEGEEKTYY